MGFCIGFSYGLADNCFNKFSQGTLTRFSPPFAEAQLKSGENKSQTLFGYETEVSEDRKSSINQC
jgi:hypothetical protein